MMGQTLKSCLVLRALYVIHHLPGSHISISNPPLLPTQPVFCSYFLSFEGKKRFKGEGGYVGQPKILPLEELFKTLLNKVSCFNISR